MTLATDTLARTYALTPLLVATKREFHSLAPSVFKMAARRQRATLLSLGRDLVNEMHSIEPHLWVRETRERGEAAKARFDAVLRRAGVVR